ncbi:unnamed protein product [Rangifer tarandus platyrhynchus]|uniref:Uncharacterized protein n=2 Tax=Rangifer tarandus platyrhynchus TaxID=3082113 RepID=A0ABN8YLJ9_RANTA|nr:unnamed protein product [Rangifer tarandus platyrhynchus]
MFPWYLLIFLKRSLVFPIHIIPINSCQNFFKASSQIPSSHDALTDYHADPPHSGSPQIPNSRDALTDYHADLPHSGSPQIPSSRDALTDYHADLPHSGSPQIPSSRYPH